MSWIAIGGAGDPYPKAIRALKGKSGVYAIRSKPGIIFGPRVLYVGESHTGNLYGTLTRHFQQWRRGPKRWFVGDYAPAQTDPGHSYDRSDCEVMVKVAGGAGRAVLLQAAWIKGYKPRDNRAGEDAPF